MDYDRPGRSADRWFGWRRGLVHVLSEAVHVLVHDLKATAVKGKALLTRIVAMLTRLLDPAEQVREADAVYEYEYGYEYVEDGKAEPARAADAPERRARQMLGVRLAAGVTSWG
jgi:hypothetical protein